MKIIALDLGDVWTGTALSDALKFLAKPYQTVKTTDLIAFLQTTFAQENIDTIVLGYPRTMKNTHSLQTEKVLEFKTKLEEIFNQKKIILWDERLSSKFAKIIQGKKARTDHTHKEHSIAAAVILQSYLQFLDASIS